MTRLIEAYQTSDGKVFMTRSEADKHQIVILTNQFGELIDIMHHNGMGAADKIKMCEKLESMVKGNPGYLLATLRNIISTIEHADSEDE